MRVKFRLQPAVWGRGHGSLHNNNIYIYTFVSLYFLTRCIYLKVQSGCKYTRIKFFSLIAS